MKQIFTTIFIAVLFIACNNQPTPQKVQPEIPKALDDNKKSSDYISKRSYEDLVESLYAELVTKNIDLQKLEEKIDQLQETSNETISPFNVFNAKNELYYNTANTHLEHVKDSLLRERIKTLIASSVQKYTKAIGTHTQLLQLINEKQLSISDLHTVVKIVKTLPIMEKYQADNLPERKTLEAYTKKQQEVINTADKMSK